MNDLLRELRDVPEVTALTRLWGMSFADLIALAAQLGIVPKTRWPTNQHLIDAIIAATHPIGAPPPAPCVDVDQQSMW